MTTWQQITTALGQEFADLGDAAGATRVLVRLLVAGALGALLGYERESRGKAAGLRTHMLVALGAALIVIAPTQKGMDDDSIARIIQGVVAGIGFLGAGAIVKGSQDQDIQGLTTAASIWMTAALGLTAGLGREATALLAAALALAVLHVLPAGSNGSASESTQPIKLPDAGERPDQQ